MTHSNQSFFSQVATFVMFHKGHMFTKKSLLLFFLFMACSTYIYAFRFLSFRRIISLEKRIRIMSSSSTSVEEEVAPVKKIHSVTVCMVPPPENTHVWQSLSEMRLKLKDPGFYRWPPHVNLLYPFLELGGTNETEEETKDRIQEIVRQLQSATSQCHPFTITLNQFGTFGGKNRGVLWLNPKSSSCMGGGDNENNLPSLVYLQQRLEEAFPVCKDLSQKGSGSFIPHMTLSHFENLESALEAQASLNLPDEPLEFTMDRVYLLERKGDGGQFLRVAQVGLGQDSQVTQVFDPPSAFPDMPSEEFDWVHEERMKLKSRRNGQRWGRRGGQRRRRRSREPRIPDTPEVIAAKRAERKAKRERLEQEQREKEASDEENL